VRREAWTVVGFDDGRSLGKVQAWRASLVVLIAESAISIQILYWSTPSLCLLFQSTLHTSANQETKRKRREEDEEDKEEVEEDEKLC
jgi:hypothetical protein